VDLKWFLDQAGMAGSMVVQDSLTAKVQDRLIKINMFNILTNIKYYLVFTISNIYEKC